MTTDAVRLMDLPVQQVHETYTCEVSQFAALGELCIRRGTRFSDEPFHKSEADQSFGYAPEVRMVCDQLRTPTRQPCGVDRTLRRAVKGVQTARSPVNDATTGGQSLHADEPWIASRQS